MANACRAFSTKHDHKPEAYATSAKQAANFLSPTKPLAEDSVFAVTIRIDSNPSNARVFFDSGI